jgi:hypothetical protein
MKEVFRAPSPAQVAVRQALLEDAGMACFVRNETMQQAIPGGLMVALFPLPDFWPTLCVIDDVDYPDAMELLRPDGSRARPGLEWVCANCGEPVPGNFNACWNCDSEGSRQASETDDGR